MPRPRREPDVVSEGVGCGVALSLEQGAYVVSLVGDLDYDALPPCRASLLGALHAEPERLVVDLAGLRFLDSSGLGLLVEIRRHCLDRGVPMTLRRPQRAVRTVLEMTGALPNLFPETEAAAAANAENPRFGGPDSLA
jgi:anti-anti-sigma factor